MSVRPNDLIDHKSLPRVSLDTDQIKRGREYGCNERDISELILQLTPSCSHKPSVCGAQAPSDIHDMIANPSSASISSTSLTESMVWATVEIWMDPISLDGPEDLEFCVLSPEDNGTEELKVAFLDVDVCVAPQQAREAPATSMKSNKRPQLRRDTVRDSKRIKVSTTEKR